MKLLEAHPWLHLTLVIVLMQETNSRKTRRSIRWQCWEDDLYAILVISRLLKKPVERSVGEFFVLSKKRGLPC